MHFQPSLFSGYSNSTVPLTLTLTLTDAYRLKLNQGTVPLTEAYRLRLNRETLPLTDALWIHGRQAVSVCVLLDVSDMNTEAVIPAGLTHIKVSHLLLMGYSLQCPFTTVTLMGVSFHRLAQMVP